MAVDESRLIENVRARATRLFDDGYRAVAADATTVIVKNPSGTLYAIDTIERTCPCNFFGNGRGGLPRSMYSAIRRCCAGRRRTSGSRSVSTVNSSPYGTKAASWSP